MRSNVGGHAREAETHYRNPQSAGLTGAIGMALGDCLLRAEGNGTRRRTGARQQPAALHHSRQQLGEDRRQLQAVTVALDREGDPRARWILAEAGPDREAAQDAAAQVGGVIRVGQ